MTARAGPAGVSGEGAAGPRPRPRPRPARGVCGGGGDTAQAEGAGPGPGVSAGPGGGVACGLGFTGGARRVSAAFRGAQAARVVRLPLLCAAFASAFPELCAGAINPRAAVIPS